MTSTLSTELQHNPTSSSYQRACIQRLPVLNPHGKRSELEVPNMRSRFRRSEIELRGPRNGLNIFNLQDLVRG
eukprot:15371818-Alexandrium_andersonii.AAC.1